MENTPPAPNTQEPVNINTPPPVETVKGNVPKSKLPLIIVFVLLLVAVPGFFFWLKNYQNKPGTQPAPSPKPQVQISEASKKIAAMAPEQTIAKVGEETLYKADLNIELASYPKNTQVDAIKILVDKMAEDSIILQGAKADGLIKLDSTVFNSQKKDYTKRIKLVATAKEAVSDKADSISGTVISLWFYNTKAGAVGYDQGKQIALTKITKLHNDVKSGKITIKQAADSIQNDTSLAQVDEAYETNASFDFEVTKGKKITLSPNFDTILWGLKTNGVSDVYLSKDRKDTGKEAVYMFGKVAKKVSSGKVVDFASWLADKRKVYLVTYE